MDEAHGGSNRTPDRGQSSMNHHHNRSMCVTGISFSHMTYSGDGEISISRRIIQEGCSAPIVSYILPINNSSSHKLWLVAHISHTLCSEEVFLIESHWRVRTRSTHIGSPNN